MVYSHTSLHTLHIQVVTHHAKVSGDAMGYELMTAETSITTQSVWLNVPVLLLGQMLTIHVTVHLEGLDTTVPAYTYSGEVFCI